MQEESIDDLFNQLNASIVEGTIEILPQLSNRELQKLINALVTEANKCKEKICK